MWRGGWTKLNNVLMPNDQTFLVLQFSRLHEPWVKTKVSNNNKCRLCCKSNVSLSFNCKTANGNWINPRALTGFGYLKLSLNRLDRRARQWHKNSASQQKDPVILIFGISTIPTMPKPLNAVNIHLELSSHTDAMSETWSCFSARQGSRSNSFL